MIDFDPRFTEVVYLDTECYVPPNSRQQGRSSMKYNPAKIGNFVLGGVFCRAFPLQKKMETPQHFWNWTMADEKITLQQIYNYFNESWKLIEGKTDKNPDLILVGTGISRHDIPTLYIRSAMHHIDNEEQLYETYLKTKIVDLGDVGIPLFRNDPRIFPIYPKTTNALTARLGLQAQGRKDSGKSVWELYELQQFDTIKERTASEVEDTIKIASSIVSRIASGRF